MNTGCRWLLIFLLMLLPLLVSSLSVAQEDIFAATTSDSQANWMTDEIIVKFKRDVDDLTIEKTNRQFETTMRALGRYGKFLRLGIPAKRKVAELVAAYRQLPEVEYAEPNYLARAHAMPNDSYYPLQWNFDNPAFGGIHMEQAWELSTGSPNVIVAVVDTGVAYENYTTRFWLWRTSYSRAPDLADTRFVPGYDFINNDAHPNDDEGHGTHVTGTIAQSTNNGIGAAGIAFDTAIMPIKVLDSNGSGSYSAIAEGIYYAADNGAKVINLSLGGPNASQTLENALAYAHGKGVTIVCSAGNDGNPTVVEYPAAYDNYCIAVGSTRYDETIAFYSNGGASLDITAPGGDLNVDQNGDGYSDGILQQTLDGSTTRFGYYFYQGTSMSAPHVSGVAALLIASGVAVTPDEVREVLQATAEDKGTPGWDPAYGWGLLDAAAALNYTATPNSPPVAAAGGPYTGTEDQVVAFDGGASFDPEGGLLTYSWDFGDGSRGSGPTPVHTYLAGAVYTVSLVVNDGLENSATVTTTATIEEVPDPPVAVINGPYNGIEKAPITFDASGSYDPEGTPLIYLWDFGDATVGSGLRPSHTYQADGVYTVSLIVNDGSLDSSPASTTAVIEAINIAPVAVVNGPYAGTEGIAVTFDSSGSNDPEGSTLSYRWDFGDGTSSGDRNPSHIYQAGGVYTVSLVVNDGLLDSSAAATTASIEEVNESPVAAPGADRTVTTGEVVTFNGSGSRDPDGTIVSYFWDFGDGTTGSGVSPSHTYASAGEYHVSLLVTDNQGGTGTGQAKVTVADPPELTMHVAAIDLVLNRTRFFWFSFVDVTARITILDANNLPVPGATVTGSWSGATSGSNTAVTGANGQATMTSSQLLNPPSGTTFVMTVNQVGLANWVYSVVDNVETSDTLRVP